MPIDDVSIYRQDTNLLVKNISADIVYIDPPYNSRQYSRFYHILENLAKWDKPKLYGIALKPEAENMSDYCRVNAKSKFVELIKDLKAKYIVVSYNNTYEPKSDSSKNKISLDDIRNILENKGSTKIFEKDYRFFTAGNTDFQNHKEYLFVTKVKNDKRN
jgi:adenine-specific DNA-methyltransferase